MTSAAMGAQRGQQAGFRLPLWQPGRSQRGGQPLDDSTVGFYRDMFETSPKTATKIVEVSGSKPVSRPRRRQAGDVFAAVGEAEQLPLVTPAKAGAQRRLHGLFRLGASRQSGADRSCWVPASPNGPSEPLPEPMLPTRIHLRPHRREPFARDAIGPAFSDLMVSGASSASGRPAGTVRKGASCRG